MLDSVQQFTGAGITLEGQRLEDGADTILNGRNQREKSSSRQEICTQIGRHQTLNNRS